MKRPTGITIIAVLLFIGGALAVLGAVTAFGVGLAGSGIWSLVIGVAELVIAWGLWTLKPWAWLGALGLIGIGALSIIIQLIVGWTALVTGIISLVIYGVIVYFLLRPDVKAAFGRK